MMILMRLYISVVVGIDVQFLSIVSDVHQVFEKKHDRPVIEEWGSAITQGKAVGTLCIRILKNGLLACVLMT